MEEQSRRQFLKYAAGAGAFAAGLSFPGVCPGAEAKKGNRLEVRGLLIHVTHYDPNWNTRKDSEEPFSIEAGLEVVETMAEHNFNTLIVDIEDGVEYKSHPELKRHYSVAMKELELLAKSARAKEIDFVPKCNFSKSGRNHHDMWMRPHWDGINWIKNMDEYWEVAGDVIDELVCVCKPQKYFHIGMDEDHYRAVSQYVEAIKILHGKIARHNLRCVMWNDTCYENRNVVAQVYADKCRAAEPRLPRDIVQLLWDYDLVHKGIVKRLTDMGFEVWVAPGRDKKQIAQWKETLLAEGGSGLVMTNWIKCSKTNKDKLINMIDKLAAAY
ncbi:MAG: twin-arginine translocation signal domain-containing protein [Planctomycetota bacterium]|jgi:hypothetical protein